MKILDAMNSLTIFVIISITSVYSQKSDSSFRCGDNWLAFRDEKCHQVLGSTYNREKAISACTGEQRSTNGFEASLLTIKSISEQKYLQHYLSYELGIDDNIWIGAKRDKNNRFKWEDGSDVLYANWAKNRPSDDSDANCVQIEPKSGKWYDISCDEKAVVVCEKNQFWTFPDLQNEFFEWKRLLEQRYDEMTETLELRDERIKTLDKSLKELEKKYKSIDKELNEFRDGFVNSVNKSIERIIRENKDINEDLHDLDKKADEIVKGMLALHDECSNGCSSGGSGGGSGSGTSDKDLESLRRELMAEITSKYNSLSDKLGNTVSDARLEIISWRRTLQIKKKDQWISLGHV